MHLKFMFKVNVLDLAKPRWVTKLNGLNCSKLEVDIKFVPVTLYLVETGKLV